MSKMNPEVAGAINQWLDGVTAAKQQGREAERADVIEYLRQRAEARHHEFGTDDNCCGVELEESEDDIKAGIHVGMATKYADADKT